LMNLLKNMWVHTVQWFDTSGKPQRYPSIVPTLKQEKIHFQQKINILIHGIKSKFNILLKTKK
jgi:hypothetical protein